jgi:uncharacterized protein DUF6459
MADSAVLDRLPPATDGGLRDAVRVLPMPRCEPPSDDERVGTAWEPPAMTALTLPLRLRPGGAQVRRRAVRGAEHAYTVDPTAGALGVTFAARGDGTGEVAVGPDDAADGLEPSQPPPALPEVRQATMRFVSTFLEVMAGYRPIAHLRQYCRPDRFERISDHLRGRAGTRAAPAQRGAAALSGRVLIVGRGTGAPPPRGGRAEQRAPGDRLAVRRVQICQVSDSVAEVVAIFRRREASAAMAFRMEKNQDRWLCAHLEIV